MVVYHANSDTVTADGFTFKKVLDPWELFGTVDLFEITIENDAFIDHLIESSQQLTNLIESGAGIYTD